MFMREFIQDHAIRIYNRLFYGFAPGSFEESIELAKKSLGKNFDESKIEKGYLTSLGRFVDPSEAKRIALRDSGSTNGCWAPCIITADQIS